MILEITCSRPPTVPNSDMEMTDNYYLGEITYSCTTGNELKDGNLVRTCMLDGQWSGEAPDCKGYNCYINIF